MTLSVKGIDCQRPKKIITPSLSFVLNRGEALQIVGKNGSGKTSLLRTLAGLLPHQRGEIQWDDRPVARWPDFKSHILYLGHRFSMLQRLTVFENLQLFLVRQPQSWVKTAFQTQKQTCLSRIQHALTIFSLWDQRSTITRHLSAGQQRRLVLATLLLSPAPFWIVDEPFTALDQAGSQLLINLMIKHLQLRGYLLMSSHQPIDCSAMPLKKIFLA